MLAKSNVLHPAQKEAKVEFSAKELEIIQLICKEGSNKEIAEEVNLTVRSVEKYRERIHEKIGARNVAGVVVYAIRQGIYKL
jgi:DNA-binding NarL/FixJ family response regulator